MKKLTISVLVLVLCITLAACGKGNSTGQPEEPTAAALADGVYSAEFKTDSTMFHVNEANDGKGILTVKDGQMTIHISLTSKNIVNLFPGTAEDAQAEGAVLLQPTVDTVTYADGMTEEVHGFDVPVPYLDAEFDCALIGTKGVWYDHKVSVCNPVAATPSEAGEPAADGEYTMAVTLTGGSGKASVTSPADIAVKDGAYTATVVWSSSHYEYMIVDGVQYDPVNTEGNSTFRIPVTPDADLAVQALTTAMSEPHLIDYVLHFDSSTLTEK